MTEADVILYIVIGTALAFDFTNGFHDTANVVATSISTRAMSPRVAVTYAAILNFAGAFISLEVAATVAADVVDGDAITPTIVFAGLVGAIVWNLTTWYYGLTFELIARAHRRRGRLDVRGGGLERGPLRRRDRQGAGARGDRPDRRLHRGRRSRSSSVTASSAGSGRARSRAASGWGRSCPGGMLALAHGTNDAQKTMGVIALALIANGSLESGSDPPTWVIVSAATAISLGTYMGGWRIIRTMGTRIIKMDAAQGFSAQGAGSAVILASSHFGYPCRRPR